MAFKRPLLIGKYGAVFYNSQMRHRWGIFFFLTREFQLSMQICRWEIGLASFKGAFPHYHRMPILSIVVSENYTAYSLDHALLILHFNKYSSFVFQAWPSWKEHVLMWNYMFSLFYKNFEVGNPWLVLQDMRVLKEFSYFSEGIRTLKTCPLL